MKTNNQQAAETGKSTTAEPENVAVRVHNNRTNIRGAICAAGPLDFGLTATEAKQLAELGLVTITGIRA